MSSITLNEQCMPSNKASMTNKKIENLDVKELRSHSISVISCETDVKENKNEEQTVDAREGSMTIKGNSDDRASGWDSVRKRLGTLVAVKTVIDSQKKQRTKKPVDQKDFLEKFSTREYSSMRNAKKASSNIASRHISLVQRGKTCNTSIDKETDKEECETKSPNNLEVKDTIVIDYSNATDSKRSKSFNFGLPGILWTFFEPYSNFIYYWSYLVNLAITYNIWVIVLRVAFIDAQTQYQTLWFLFDYVADFIYLLDIIISSRTSFLENGIYVDDLKRMAMAYLKSYQFALDSVSVLPLDLLYFAIGTTPTLRLLRILKYYKTFGSQKTILALTTHPNVLRTIIFLHIMLIMMHWNACFYFIISKYEGFGVNSWVYPNFDGKTQLLSYQYAFCYYWSTLSLTTIGGSAHPETTVE